MQSSTGFHIFLDSGPPGGSADYTTIVIIHGLGWHSGVFTKLIPLAHAHNARVVLVNRRDYRGAAPYSLAERTHLFTTAAEALTDGTAACPKVVSIMKEEAIDVSRLLTHFISDNRVPLARPHANSGGIVLVGWSLGTAWMTALLAHGAPRHANAVDLTEYVRRIVFYDPPHLALGFSPPEGVYFPFVNPAIPPEDLVEAFCVWVTGVVTHGETCTADTLDLGEPPASLPSTFRNLTAEERCSVVDPVPADPRGGSDTTLMNAALFSGAFAVLREEALRVRAPGDGLGGWDAVEVRHVWCDASPWPMPWAATCLREDVAGKRKAGGSVRDLAFTRLRGANHLAHWEEPGRVLQAFLE
ncbi:hypothetical protein GSI_03180 [Ganoderma sinense ZZ0214-1]|uniref:AB hydrolase-1 domain-containing protein n=1 Tax=Ganoderma sinense ZZ0214-1 TaxID=1077348 RepID=A0A2G8SKW5_9APHY|nr:hypothetical protein GSI_03180 [Ganoderma sinense ZZ0214-1]